MKKNVPAIKTSNFFDFNVPEIFLKSFKQDVYYDSWFNDPLKKYVYGYTVPTIRWDSKNNAYVDVDSFPKLEKPAKIRFLTYNIWFDLQNFKQRQEALLEEFKKADADFICLQEVLRDSYAYFLNSSYIKDNYCASSVSTDGYFCVMFSKFDVKFEEYTFETGMGRKLLRAVGSFNDGTSFGINTAHFESLNTAKIRKVQFEKTFKIMKGDSLAVLMGDFNFDWPEEYLNFPKEYIDFWPSLKGTEEGFTMPKTTHFAAWRPDKVLMKENKIYKPASIARVGMTPLELYKSKTVNFKDEVTTPSDHYGLVSEIQLI